MPSNLTVSCFTLHHFCAFVRFAPQLSTLEIWVKAFAKYHEITLERAKDIVAKYMLSRHSLPELHNPVRHLPLVPWDNDNVAFIYHVMENLPPPSKKSGPNVNSLQVSLVPFINSSYSFRHSSYGYLVLRCVPVCQFCQCALSSPRLPQQSCTY